MASEAFVSFVVGKLGDLLIQEVQLLNEVDDQFEWIESELKRMQWYLKNADSKLKGDEKANFMEKIRDVSYDAEDVIDTYILSKTVQRRRRGFERRVQKYACIINELRTRREVVKQIKRIKLKIRDISERVVSYVSHVGRQEASSSTPNLQERWRSSALLQESEVVGLQDEIKTLSEQLVNEEERRSVISIVGMGGSGKTALARKVFHHVKDDFDCHAFIYLSQEYVMKDVVMRIIECVMRLSPCEEAERLDEWDLKKKLCDYLEGKRYLVVVDDIWSRRAWDDLNRILPDTRQSKSRVMLTTRNRDIALHADPVNPPHEMRLLNADEGWELFMKNVFPGENPSAACPSELEETGRDMFAKCGGLPLAILILGDLLARREKTLNAWSKVFEAVTSSFDKCLEILALSYRDLPHYLIPCFLYFGLFPPYYEIHAGRLIRLWIAEGFIRPRWNGPMELEDIAEKYLEELVSRSMIQVASKRSNGSIRTCRIHDFFHHLSISEAGQNNFFQIHKDEGTLSFSTRMRRLALHRKIVRYEKENHSTSTLRSILCFPASGVYLLELLKVSGKLLRVVDANWADIGRVTLTKEVGDFVGLRYLDLRHSTITEPRYSPKKIKNKTVECLPSSIGNLSKLQTLRLSYGGNLPDTISNLEQLRHLKADGELPDGQPKLNTLTNLQTLGLRAGSWIEDDLARLTNLRKLGILGDVSSYDDTLPHCIEKLRNLRSLKLMGSSCYPIPPFMPFTHHLHLYKISLEGSIKKLPEMPPNLVQLYLYGSDLEQDAISALEKLQNLKILRLCLGSYLSKQMICSPGGFPLLELLELDSLPLEELKVEEGAMIPLKSVHLGYMPELKIETLPKGVSVLLKEN